ncbi:MAG: TonB-dependent receptor [Acidobacteria bacterium]|nr:TonB-dependent receptor [Acidobacteriota bacterium]
MARKTVAVWLSTLLLASVAAAQSSLGTITGLLTDATGSVVPNAKVTTRNVATGAQGETASSSTGNYVLSNLPVGTYEITVSVPGFKGWTRSGIALSSGDNLRIDITLEVGQVTERVSVSADAPVLKTESTEVSSTMERELVQNLPLPIAGIGGGMRNAFSIMMMLPQVKSNDGQSAWDDFVVGGGQGFAWNVSVDGLTVEIGFRNHPGYMNRLTPPIDSVEEFRIETAAFKAEDSHASGGMISMVTKSGGNQLHGSLFDHYQTQRLDANTWLNNRLGNPKSVYHRNDFGATVGGPVYLPKVYNGKNKSYFFFSYEGYRFPSTYGAAELTIPLPEMKTGDFSRWRLANGAVIPIYDPTTTRANPAGGFLRDPFPDNRIPGSRISPVSRNIVRYMPNPNVADALVRNYRTPPGGATKRIENAFMTKFDHNIGAKNRLAFTFSKNGVFWNANYNTDRQTAVNWGTSLPFPLAGRRYTRVDEYWGQVYRFSDTHMITPTLINNVTLGYHRLYHPEHDVTAYPQGQNWGEVLGGIKNNPGWNWHFPAVRFSTDNYYGWESTKAYDEYHNVYGVDENLTWIRGSHTFKFGYTYGRIHVHRGNDNQKAGDLFFHRLETARPEDNSGNSGSSFASLLLGAVDNGTFSTGYGQLLRYPSHAFFLQDDWKITPRLTANAGFRFEFNPAVYEKHDRLSFFDARLANPSANGLPGAMQFVGSGPGRTGSRSFYPGQKGYGPRAGLAYQVTSKTVLRAGFGMFYSNYKLWGANLGFYAQPTFVSTDQGVTPAFYWDNGWPVWQQPPAIDPAFNAGSSVPWFHVDDIARMPTSTTWNLALARVLPSAVVLDFTYTGSKGTYLGSNRDNYMQIDPKYAYLGSLLNRRIDDPSVAALGFRPPFPDFVKLMGTNASLGQALRMFPQYTNVGGGSWQQYNGNSTYHALIIKVTKRYSNGLSLLASHTWSKTLTDADMELPNVAIGAGIGFSAAQNHYNQRVEKSYSALDLTHQFKLTASYDLPFGKGKKYLTGGVGRWIAGQWNLATFTFVNSGFPIGVVDNGYNNFLRGGPPRPNVLTHDWRAAVGGDQFDPSRDLFLDRTAFQRRTDPRIDPFGNAPRLLGTVRSFPIIRENIAATRGFSIRERTRGELRWEIFDLFNHKTWSLPPLDLSNTQFGRITNAAGNRTMQVGLRFVF